MTHKDKCFFIYNLIIEEYKYYHESNSLLEIIFLKPVHSWPPQKNHQYVLL